MPKHDDQLDTLVQILDGVADASNALIGNDVAGEANYEQVVARLVKE
jgi:hypothetical protein